jgi:hypothetical protein
MTLSMPPKRICQPDHPLRPPCWRWLRAFSFVDHNQRPIRQKDDEWVRRTWRFVRLLRHGPSDEAKQKLIRRMPAIFEAHRLYTDAQVFLRWEVEARLLTDEPIAQIASKCGSTPEVIEAYHAVFFHVRDRRQASDYIVHQVIGPKLHFGLKEGDVDVILKLYAFGGGVHVVDVLVDYYRRPPVVPPRPELLSPDALKELKTKLQIRAAIVARVLPLKFSLLKKLAILRDATAVFDSSRENGIAPTPFLPVPLQTLINLSKERVASPRMLADPGSDVNPDAGRSDPEGRRVRPCGDTAIEPGQKKVAVA